MMQRLGTLRSKGRWGHATAVLLALLLALTLTLIWAGSAVAQQSVVAQRQAVIEGILAENADDPAALQSAIENIFGNVQGDEAVARAQQILSALPSELTDAQWAAVKAAIGAKAGTLISAVATQAINSELAAKESALGKTQLQASVVAEDGGVTEDGGDTGESSSAPGAPLAPPLDQVVCVSASCQ
jgi:hypothetical protein